MKIWQFIAALMLFPQTLWGAGAILVDTEGSGAPVLWQDGIVHLNLESGPDGTLGVLSNSEATQLIREFFQDWQSVTINGIPTVNITLIEGPGLGSVTVDNLNDHFAYCPPDETCPNEDPPFIIGSARTGESPILFDTDGSITDAIQGKGASRSILGFAGPRVVERVGGVMQIMEGQGVLNGKFIDGISSPVNPEVPLDDYEGAIFHEVGHFIGLDHSQVNLSSATKFFSGDTSEKEAIPTMFPLFLDGADQFSLHFDDKVSISALYPTIEFLNSFCRLEGTVFRIDGVTELQGVNVVAASVDDPLAESTSFVSGAEFTGTPDGCDHDFGGFVIAGLSPQVDYNIRIELISRAFTGGSSVEPCDPPQDGFDPLTLPGTFRCESAGQVITTGTEATTDIVTNKANIVPPKDTSTGGGCSLLPLFP